MCDYLPGVYFSKHQADTIVHYFTCHLAGTLTNSNRPKRYAMFFLHLSKNVASITLDKHPLDFLYL